MSVRGIILRDSIVIDSVADIENELQLAADEPMALSKASESGKIQLRLFASALAGAADFDITSIEYSYDGTTWRNWETFGAAITVDANGELVGPVITNFFPPDAQHVRLQITDNTVGGLDAGDNITLHAALEVVN